MLAVAPLMLFFAWHDGIASIGDDSVSYLILAQYFTGHAAPFVREWVGYQAHFGPLFPLVLAAAGGASSVLAAHLVVAAFAIAALVLLYRHALLQLGSPRPALAIVAFFLLTPTAWIGLVGILSEPQYLFFTLAALLFHEARLHPARAGAREWLAFGVLLAAAWLTRAAGVALLAATVAHVLVRLFTDRQTPRGRFLLAFVPPLLLGALWMGVRPTPEGANYARVLDTALAILQHDPARFFGLSARYLSSGWVASFSAESDVHRAAQGVFLALGALGVAGAVRRALHNHLDGWYVLASLAMLAVWLFPEDTMRRLLYPLVPLLLVHAAGFTRFLAGRMRSKRPARLLLAAALLPPALLCLPALALVFSKALERAPVVAGFPYSFAGITEYYTTIRVHGARSIAARHAAVLTGLQALQTDTPVGARVMWMRPDYVALLGHRQGVPWHYGRGLRGLAEALRRSNADYVIVATLYKSDMDGEQTEPFDGLPALAPFAQPVSVVRNAVLGGNDFALLQVDHGALDAYLRAAR
jgi:hypothetical protein